MLSQFPEERSEPESREARSLSHILLAILFAAGRPVTLEQISERLQFDLSAIRSSMDKLIAELEDSGPLQIIEIQEGFQLCTKPSFSEEVAAFLKPEPTKLSRSLMETLAIVAYRQPITSSEIELVRGVQSDYSVHALADRGLIEEVGRKSAPGRPILYGTTAMFLHHFKLKNLENLPQVDMSSMPKLEATSQPILPDKDGPTL